MAKVVNPDTPWISLTATKGLPIQVSRIAWMKVELWEQDLGQKDVVITFSSRREWPQLILGMNTIQGLNAAGHLAHFGLPREIRQLLPAFSTFVKKGIIRIPYECQLSP